PTKAPRARTARGAFACPGGEPDTIEEQTIVTATTLDEHTDPTGQPALGADPTGQLALGADPTGQLALGADPTAAPAFCAGPAATPTADAQIAQLRDRIDEIDVELINLWQERAAISQEVGV